MPKQGKRARKENERANRARSDSENSNDTDSNSPHGRGKRRRWEKAHAHEMWTTENSEAFYKWLLFESGSTAALAVREITEGRSLKPVAPTHPEEIIDPDTGEPRGEGTSSKSEMDQYRNALRDLPRRIEKWEESRAHVFSILSSHPIDKIRNYIDSNYALEKMKCKLDDHP